MKRRYAGRVKQCLACVVALATTIVQWSAIPNLSVDWLLELSTHNCYKIVKDRLLNEATLDFLRNI